MSSPISLNGILINDTSGKKLYFKGGYLSFAMSEDTENNKGLLCICESECLILEFQLHGFLVPNEVTINFDLLVLSQERASINFKNLQTVSEMESLIETIVQNVSLSSLERNALLNALSPIIGSDRCNLTKKICDSIAIPDKTISSNDFKDNIPEEKERLKSNEDKCLFLNPLYFSSSDYPSFYEGENYLIYSITTTSEELLSVLKKDDIYHIFIDEKLFVTEHPSEFEYNLHLLNHWLKNKGYSFSVEVLDVLAKKCSLITKPKKIETESELAISQAPSLDWESYDDIDISIFKDGEEHLLFEYLIEYSSKYFYPNDDVLRNGYCGMWTQSFILASSLKDVTLKFSPEFLKNYTKPDIEFFIENHSAKDMEMFCIFWKTVIFTPKLKHLKYFCEILTSESQPFAHFNSLSRPPFFEFLEKLFATNISVDLSIACLNGLVLSRPYSTSFRVLVCNEFQIYLLLF